MKRIAKQVWGRWLAGLLSVAMVLTLLPATALAEEASGTTGQTAVEQVQALIDALPDADTITADNRADVEEQLNAIDEAKLALDDEEIDQLDTSRYMEAAEAIMALDGMAGADVPKTIAFPDDLPGSGSEESPYEIGSAADLKALQEYVNKGNDCANTYFVLTASIDLGGSQEEQWTPIGNRKIYFQGTFDGGNCTISGLHVTSKTANYESGLFGWVGNSGTVKNLSASGYVSGKAFAGGIVANNEGTISNCSFDGTVINESANSVDVGGIAGYSEGSISNCRNNSKVTNNSTRAGGIVGDNRGPVTNCSNSGEISGTGANTRVGGITGSNVSDEPITGCVNTGNITAVRYPAGIVSSNINGTISNCYNTGKISASNGYPGGIAGSGIHGTIKNCYNSGTVSGANSGNIIGYASDDTITNCYFLKGSINDSVGSGSHTGEATEKSFEEFASGEVAWLLQNGQEDETQVWGQALKGNPDKYPVLTDSLEKKVCKVTFHTESEPEYDVKYTNKNGTVTLPNNPTFEGKLFDHWSTEHGTSGEAKFDNDTEVTKDITVYAMEKETFGVKSGEITLTTTYGKELTENLSEHIEYKSGTAASGKFTYTITDGNDELDAIIEGDNLKIPGTANAKDYTLTIVAEETEPQYSLMSIDTYGTVPVTLIVKVSIAKAESSVTTAPTPNNRAYDGADHPLVEAGTAEGGTIQYSLNENEGYSEAIPNSQGAKSYKVWYKVVGDANHNDTEPESVNVTIGKGVGTGTVTMEDYLCGDISVNPVAASTTNDTADVKYTYAKRGEGGEEPLSEKPTTAGKYTVKAEFKETENYNSFTATANFTIYHHFNDGWAEGSDGYHHICPCDTDVRLQETELEKVPDSLKDIDTLDSVDKITQVLVEEVRKDTSIPENNTAVYDVRLQIKSGGFDWVDVTGENFPEGGITVILPYPKGTNSSYTFTVIHMITTGADPGQMEKLEPTNSENGISFTVNSLSPICVGWTAPPSPSTGYRVTIPSDLEGGSVTSDRTSARQGSKVTLTVEPDEGYHLASLTVTDRNGEPVELTDNGDGTYTFTMPSSRVTVEAEFIKTTAPTDITVTVSEAPAYGSDITLTAAVTSDSMDAVDITGSVQFTAGGEALGGPVAVENGTATLTVSAADAAGQKALFGEDGTSAVTAEYSGNDDIGSSTGTANVTIAKRALAYTVTAANKAYDGKPDIAVTLTPTNALPGDDVTLTATGNVEKADVGKYYTVDLSDITLSGDDARYYTIEASKDGVALASPVSIIEGTGEAALHGTVTQDGKPVAGATVTLKQGDRTISTATTGADGTYSFPNVAPGVYDIVVQTKDGKTMTMMVTITGKTGTERELDLPVEDVNSVLDVQGMGTIVVVGGLDAVAKDHAVSGSTVIVTMTIKRETESTADHAQAIKAVAGGRKLEYMEIGLEKTTETDGQSNTKALTTTRQLITIVLRFDLTDKSNVVVYRYHSGNVDTLTETANGDGEYIVLDQAGGTITLHVKNFSTYAIGYTQESQTPTPPDTPDIPGTSGTPGASGTLGIPGSSGTPSYDITIPPRTEGGTVRSSQTTAQSGSDVTLTATPDDGYHFDSLTVTDGDGKTVELTDNGDGTYTFTMPSGKVTVEAEFVRCVSLNFTDLDVKAWYHDYTDYVIVHGLMRGIGGGLFGPDGTVSRAQMVTVLWNMSDKPEVNYYLTYSDVSEGAWYAEAIRWAASEGIVGGYGNGRFGPNDTITREQMAVMLYRYEQKYGGGGFSGDWMYRLPFTDLDKLSDWAFEAVAWCNMKGIMSGKSNDIFDPKGPAKRSEMAAILTRYLTQDKRYLISSR